MTILYITDDALFLDHFGNDGDDDLSSCALDRETGGLLWFYDEDGQADAWGPEENRKIRERVQAAPGRFLLVERPCDQRLILQEFLDSKWTSVEVAREKAWAEYSGSIGRWLAAVDEPTEQAYRKFREHRVTQLAESFLKENGIEPVWSEQRH